MTRPEVKHQYCWDCGVRLTSKEIGKNKLGKNRRCAECKAKPRKRYKVKHKGKPCIACGRFHDSGYKYCGFCRENSIIGFANCVVCGEQFPKSRTKQKTCSPECGRVLSGENLAAVAGTHDYTPIAIGNCKQCGELFARRNLGRNSFCSRYCSDQYYGSKRKHTKRCATPETAEDVSIHALIERDYGLCVYCGSPVSVNGGTPRTKATVDHVVPLSKGGEHVLDNTVLCCLSCNSSKGNKSLLEFISWRAQNSQEPATSGGGCFDSHEGDNSFPLTQMCSF